MPSRKFAYAKQACQLVNILDRLGFSHVNNLKALKTQLMLVKTAGGFTESKVLWQNTIIRSTAPSGLLPCPEDFARTDTLFIC